MDGTAQVCPRGRRVCKTDRRYSSARQTDVLPPARKMTRSLDAMIRDHCLPGPYGLNGLIAGSVGICQTFECQRARNDDIPPRASQESRAIVIGPFFENRHHIDKTLERIESDNRVKGIGFSGRCRSFEKGEREVIRAIRRRHDHPDRTPENRGSSPRLRPRHENADFLLAFSHTAEKTLLSFIEVGG